MKKYDIQEITLIMIIIILGIYISLNLFKDEKVIFISDNDYLYNKAINYLIKNDSNINKNKSHYKLFTDYTGFGIAQDKKYKYAYMWIVTDSYYINNNELINESSSSTPYKFVFDKKKEKIINVYTPEDGRQYNISIKNLFPKKIADNILKYEYDDTILQKKIKDYYKDRLK